MAVVPSKIIAAASLALLLGSCAPMSWQKHSMDGSRTGVTAVTGADVDRALGALTDSSYIAPNGREFALESSTARAAAALIGVQPGMAYLKEVLAQCPRGMSKYQPESELANWSADLARTIVERYFSCKVDLSIMNTGGIRVDMPEGDVLLDDILSMFPFHNAYVCLELKGSDVLKAFEHMAETGFAAVSGVKVVASDRKIVSLEIGGEPLDPERWYTLATIDFLLDGGDGYFLGEGARNLRATPWDLKEYAVAYLRELGKAGIPIEAQIEGRVTII